MRDNHPSSDICPPSSDLCFAGLVALAKGPNPIPFRTRPLNPSAPMVLSLKAWESRSLPGLPITDNRRQRSEDRQSVSRPLQLIHTRFFSFAAAFGAVSAKDVKPRFCRLFSVFRPLIIAGWSSPVARQAHNLKVIGSNPIPATTSSP